MTIPFYSPSLIIENISTKSVRLLGLTTILPGQTVNLFDEVDATTLYEDLIIKGLERPWGDLYNEVVLKKTLVIHSIDLSSFHYGIVGPKNLSATNTYFPGAIASVVDDDRFAWISVAVTSVVPPLQLSSGVLSLPPASAISDGYLTKEDWLTFTANIRPPLKIWQYQDFTAPVSSSVSLSSFQNGTGVSFNSSYILNDTAVIVLSADSSTPPTTTLSIPAKYLPSNRVKVTSHIGTTVILSAAPETSLSCRVFYLIELPAGVSLPSGYQEDPEFANDASNDYLDDNYVNQNQDEGVYGVKTFANQAVFDAGIKIPSGATPGFVLKSDGAGNASWQPGGGGGGGDGYWESTDGTDIFTINPGNVGIGTYYPDGYAKLDIVSTDSGILIPRLNQAQRDGIVGGPDGLLIYNTTQNRINIYDGYLESWIDSSFPVSSSAAPSNPYNGQLWFNTNDELIYLYTYSVWRPLLTEMSHDDLDDLTHNLAESYYEEFTYTGSKVSGIVVWTNISKVLKVRETLLSYSGSKVLQEVNIQYDALGAEKQRLTATYSYSGSSISSITVVEIGL